MRLHSSPDVPLRFFKRRNAAVILHGSRTGVIAGKRQLNIPVIVAEQSAQVRDSSRVPSSRIEPKRVTPSGTGTFPATCARTAPGPSCSAMNAAVDSAARCSFADSPPITRTTNRARTRRFLML